MHGTAALDRINTAERRILFFLRTTTLFSVYYLGKGIIFSTLLSFKWPTVSNKAFYPRLSKHSPPSFVPRGNFLLTLQILSLDSVWSRLPALVSSLLLH